MIRHPPAKEQDADYAIELAERVFDMIVET